jgi:hypothetical protein
MQTLNQIADDIAYKLGEPFNYILKENLKYTVKYWRAVLIRRDLERNAPSVELYQSFVVPLIKVDKADNCYQPVNCIVLKTDRDVPASVRIKSDVPYKFVGSIERSINFTYTHLEELPLTFENEYTSNVIRYSLINRRLYIYNNTKFQNVCIEDIWADPSEVNICDTDCYTDDKPFPLPDDILALIVSSILNGQYKVLSAQEVKIENKP